MHILEINRLNASFSSKQVLFDINIRIKQGKKTAIVGESGSGKTVLAQGMMQLNPAVSFTGELCYQGKNVLGQAARELQKLRGKEIGMVFQEPMTALNPVMPVGKQIAEVLTLHLGLDRKQAWEKAVDLLRETGIHEPEQKVFAYPFQLSGGQRQRAMIAMAIAAEPKLLIADEPTTALDIAVQAQILDLLAKLQHHHQMTLLYITHDLNLVRRFADDVIVMHQGRVVEQGAVAEIFTSPQHDYTKILLNAVPKRHVMPIAPTAQTVLAAHDMGVTVKERKGWFRSSEKVLLQPLSFELKQGETLGVIGESGSGKTTLAKALLHLIDIKGSVLLNGQTWSPNNRREIQMVFQDPFGAFNPRMMVREIVAEALTVYEPTLSREAVTQRVIETLQAVGLPADILTRYPHEFSGGQRQRLAIARAIIVRPSVLILDEPTSALDVQWQQQILKLLAQLQYEHDLSLLMISHDLAVIRALSHRVMVLQAGNIVETGECEQVFAMPQHEYTRELLLHGY